ncbi:MAG: phosphoribosylformylglycinamidine synthase subunit PurL [Elusimicrobiota bacterium]
MELNSKIKDEIDFINTGISEITRLNQIYGWSLNNNELLMIKEYFSKLKRNPTRCEIETIAQTWSEHCKHKTFSGPVEFLWKDCNGKIKKKEKIENLFKQTIVYATKKLNKKYCLSVFKDNAGIIELDEKSKWGICFKVETHNHPCALEPYGGAETGVGGVIRDILGVGLGAKPVLNTDVFCFAFPDKTYGLSKGFLTPHKIISGVVKGVRDYGNKMGIPTASGSIFFDDDYLYNPLVYVGCTGIIPKDKINKKVLPGNLIFVLGGATGRDGIGGATFSSSDIDEKTSSSHVQIGHAINEKKLLDVLLKARDLGLYNAVTDCGAGGFSSAVGELASNCGAEVRLENVILKDKNIQPWEIWLSESQERMVLAVPEEKVETLIEICKIEECQYYIIGRFTNDKKLKVYYKNQSIAELDMDFLHAGLPKIPKRAVYKERKMVNNFRRIEYSDFSYRFKKVISDLNVCSRKWVVEQYDHEVMGQTVLKSFCSLTQSVPSDATVIWPANVINDFNSYRGFAVSCGIAPSFSKISPYDMSFYAVDEAVRNLVCVGADITHGAILDNFCSANPNIEEVMGDFTASAIGAKEAAILMELPFISGKDSFYNQTVIGNKNYKIPVTLLISAVAPVKDVRKIVTQDFKKADNPVYVIGKFLPGLGGSVYQRLFEPENNYISPINLKENKKIYLRLISAMQKGLIHSAHDVSDGGFISCVFEMCLGGIGVEVNIYKILEKFKISDVETFFGECGSKIVVEVDKNKEKEFVKLMGNLSYVKLGYTLKNPSFIVRNNGNIVFSEDIYKFKKLWERNIL